MTSSVAVSVYVPAQRLEMSSKTPEKAPEPDQDNVNGFMPVTVVVISPSQTPKHETMVESSTTIVGTASLETVITVDSIHPLPSVTSTV